MTVTGQRHGAPAARPESDKQQAAAIGEPPDRSSRRPEFVIEIWASPQLRQQNPGRARTLSEALEAGCQPSPHRNPEPDPEPEIEP